MSESETLSIEEALNKADDLAKAGKRDLAAGLYSAVLKARPDNVAARAGLERLGQATPEAEETRIMGLYREGRFLEVEQQSKLLIEKGYKTARIFNFLAVAQQRQGRLAEAAESYKSAIETDPNYADSYNNLANVLNDMDKVDQALTYCNKALEIRPDYPEALNNKGTALRKKSSLTDAMECYEKAIALNPNYGTPYSNLSNIYSELGKDSKALAVLTRVPTTAKDFSIYSRIGHLCVALERWQEAYESYSMASKLESGSGDALYNLAFSHLQLIF